MHVVRRSWSRQTKRDLKTCVTDEHARNVFFAEASFRGGWGGPSPPPPPPPKEKEKKKKREKKRKKEKEKRKKEKKKKEGNYE